MINIFSLLKESQAQQIYIQGQPVDDLIGTVHTMYGRGAPTVYDDSGFNKNDYVNPVFQNIAGMVSGDRIPVQNSIKALYLLAKYQNRQLPNYNTLKLNIQTLINQVTNVTVDTSIPTNKIIAMGNNQWGLIFKINNLTKQRTINKAVKEELLRQGRSPDESWRYFRADSSQGLDIYQISPSVISIVATILQNEGYDVTDMIQKPQDQSQQALKRFDATLLSDGGVEIGFDYNADLVKFVKKARRRRFNGKERRTWTIYEDKKFFEELEKYLSSNGYDTSKLKDIINGKAIAAPAEVRQEKKGEVLYYDIYDLTNGMFHISIVPTGGLLSKDISEFLRFSFPYWVGRKKFKEAQDPNNTELKDAAIRTVNLNPSYVSIDSRTGKKLWGHEIRGLFSDYFAIEGIISKFGYDTKGFRDIVMSLYKRGVVQKDAIPGVLDGFRKKDPTGERAFANDDEAFYKTIDNNYKLRQKDGTEKELWPLQKEGVAFLYSRKSAILGDSTGSGKCQSKDTLVNSNLGVFEIQELWNKYGNIENIYFIDNEDEEIIYPKEEIFVNSIDDNGKVVKGKVNFLYREKYRGKLRKIKTSNGKEITVSFPHKFLTHCGWSNNLKVGDIVCSSSRQPHLSNSYSNISSELAEFLAWQIAEGHETKYGISITQSDIKVLDKLKDIFDNFDFRVSYNKDRKIKSSIIKPNNRTSYLSISSISYKKYLESIGYQWGRKSKDKEIPDCVMMAKDDIVKIFLKSFFDAEGYCSKKSRRIGITSASKKLIFQLSILLQRFNILCTFRTMMKCATNGTKIKRPYYELNIIGSGVHKFMDEIGFGYAYKNDNFNNIKSETNFNKEGKPVHIVLSKFFDNYDLPLKLLNIPSKNFVIGARGWNSDTINKTIKSFDSLVVGDTKEEYGKLRRSKWTDKTTAVLERIDNKLVQEIVKDLSIMANNDLQYEKIISIEIIEYDDYIYDLNIEKYHNYIAENLICHNTYESLVAADMRLAISGGKCLIITLPAAMLQWENSIKNLKGDNELISYDVTNGSKWTILSYNNLTNASKADPNNPKIRKRDILIDNIKKVGGFTTLIIDECHMVKNNAIQTRNIMAVAEGIPYVWGLSATIIANKPIDAYRQLKVIGHRLGQLPLKIFKEHFGGFVRIKGKTRRGKLEKGDESQILKAASQLRKWLTLSGVYIKRSKRDINPDLPNHIIQDNEVNVDTKALFADIAKRMQNYTNPALVVSQMQAQRTELAKIKVSFSLDLAKSVLMQGKKVIVFTCFKDSAEMLMSGLQKIINDEVEEGGVVLGYLGGVPQATRDSYKALMQDQKSPAKAMVISILAGGTGLDLPNVVDDVIINDFSWTPKDAEQSEGRAFRITSENDVTTTYVVAANSPDQEFYDYVQIKKNLSQMIGNLTSLESQLVMQGKKPVDVQKQIEELQKKDQSLDVGILDYVKKFMGSLTGVGNKLSSDKFNMKQYKIS